MKTIKYTLIVACLLPALSWAQSGTTNFQEFVGGQLGGPKVKLDRDDFGRTRGMVGNSRVDILKDGEAGMTTGTVGNENMNVYTDPFGNTRGMIGGEAVELQRRDGGLVEGTIGGRRVVCDVAPFGNIICKR